MMSVIHLDGTLKADLSWQPQRIKARQCIEQNQRLMWDIDLGLFSKLLFPLQDQTQCLALKLSLECFRDTLWKEFQDHTDGLCLYCGNADMSTVLPWSMEQTDVFQQWLKDRFVDIVLLEEEVGISLSSFKQIQRKTLETTDTGKHLIRLFCRDTAAEFMTLLTTGLPDLLPLFITLHIDPAACLSPLTQMQLLLKERYQRFTINSDCKLLNYNSQATIGICMPSYLFVRKQQYAGFERALQWLTDHSIPFRIIPEAFLTAEWDGLDFLLVTPDGLSATGRRKLLGFCAAGGVIINTGSRCLDVPKEYSFFDWQRDFKEI